MSGTSNIRGLVVHASVFKKISKFPYKTKLGANFRMENNFDVEEEENKTRNTIDETSLIAICNEKHETRSKETSSRPVMACAGNKSPERSHTLAGEVVHLTKVNEFDNFLDDRRENAPVDVMHFITEDDVHQVQSAISKDDNEKQILNEKDLSLGGPSSSSDQFGGNDMGQQSDHVTGASQLIKGDKEAMSEKSTVVVSEISERSSPYFVPVITDNGNKASMLPLAEKNTGRSSSL